MRDKKSKKEQVCTSVDSDVYNFIEGMAQRERRTMSEMASILLENAIKERFRQRKKNAKEDSTSDNT